MAPAYDLPRIEAAAGGPARFRATTGSTQDDAKAAADEGAPAFAVFLADEQTAGRGRHGRTWTAAPGSALLTSVLLRPAVQPEELPKIALVVGLAIAEALADRVEGVGIKWPNDVLVRGRKVSGVLVEGVFRGGTLGSVVAGFGVNVLRAAVPPDLSQRATSLEDEGAPDLDRTAVLTAILSRLRARVAAFEAGGWPDVLASLRARDVLRGRRVHGQDVMGHAAGIADDGGLLVDVGPLCVTVQAGEVAVL